jgi:hypothetical protein
MLGRPGTSVGSGGQPTSGFRRCLSLGSLAACAVGGSLNGKVEVLCREKVTGTFRVAEILADAAFEEETAFDEDLDGDADFGGEPG